MNYANSIKNKYNRNKEAQDKERTKQHLAPLSLEFHIDISYSKYRNFCYDMGGTPKTKVEFLRTEIT